MKWFSWNGIVKEAKRVRWPKGEDLLKNSTTVIVFVAFLGVFFFLCQVLISGFLKLLGM
jgi:preprotein translocase SecE subunit